MTLAAIAARKQGDEATQRRVARQVWVAETALLAALVAYAAVVVPGQTRNLRLDAGGIVDAIEFVTAMLCLLRAKTRRNVTRLAPTLFGLAILIWCLGDTLRTVLALHGATPNVLANVSLVHLGAFPLLLAAIVTSTHVHRTKLRFVQALDGGIAALGFAGVFAALIHPTSVDFSAQLNVAVASLGNRVGDLLLVGLLVGVGVISRSWRNPTWQLLIVAAFVAPLGAPVNVLDTYFGRSQATDVAGSIAWPVAFILVSVAIWIAPSSSLHRAIPAHEFALPGIAAAGALGVLVSGSGGQPVDSMAVALAIVTFLGCGARFSLAIRQLGVLSLEGGQKLFIDELTGLGNRRYLSQVLGGFFENDGAPQARLAFLFIDLDHFKEINDSFGHPAGDRLLSAIGPRLASCLGESDLLVRLGGDEFAAVLQGADASYAKEVAGQIVTSLEEPFGFDRVKANISASIGIALAPTHAKDSSSLLRCADTAMYRAKQKNVPFVVYNSNLDDDGDRLRFIEELSDAVEGNLFELHYQPQLDLSDGTVTGVEALIRWRHPRLGYIPPMQFLSLAEGAVLMPSLTALVLDGALIQCARWRQKGHRVRVSVNVSASNLLDEGFTTLVKERLSRHGVPPDGLVLEITETSIIGNFAQSRQVVEELRAVGIETSIDDFGAGFTSLAYLGKLAVAEMKLDRTFIVPLAEGERERSLKLVRSTIELGHSLNLRVVAEGIEDDETLELLRSLGCDFAQGNLIGAPAPAKNLDFSKWNAPAVAEIAVATASHPSSRRRPRLRVVNPARQTKAADGSAS